MKQVGCCAVAYYCCEFICVVALVTDRSYKPYNAILLSCRNVL